MNNKTHRHPLEVTYDEIRRCVNRLNVYESSGLAQENEKIELRELRSHLHAAYKAIPDRFRVTYYEKRKETDQQ